MGPSVGIIIPAFHPDLPQLRAYIETLEEVVDPDELRLEFDDPNREISNETLSDLACTVNLVRQRRGKGQAITEGFDALDTDILAFVDADGSVPADSVSKIIEGLTSGPVSVGSRRHPEATIRSHQTVVRRTLGEGFAWLARRLLPVQLHDFQCGGKAITRAGWLTIRDNISEQGFAWDIELLGYATAYGFQVVEVPITWEDRPGSTVSPIETSIDLFRTLLRMRREAHVDRSVRMPQNSFSSPTEDPFRP